MAWLAINKDGSETIFSRKPFRAQEFIPKARVFIDLPFWNASSDDYGNRYDSISLPKGSVEKLLGRKLTWQDNPVEL